MLLDIVKKGTTDYSCVIRIVDSTDGTPETAFTFESSGIDLWYRRPQAAHTSITEATQTESGAHSDGGFVHISDGCYRLDLPDAAVATGVEYVDVGGTITGAVVIGGRIKLVDNYAADIMARLGAPAGASVSADIAAIEAQTDDIGTAGAGLTAVPWNAAWDAEVQSEVADALGAIGLDHLVSASVTGTDVADNSIIARLASSAATADWDTYVNTTDALQALRDRGDAAWTTGGGGSIAHIINWNWMGACQTGVVDLANTKTHRLGIAVTNQLDDLPTGASELTAGTISIDRSAQGGTSWSSVVADEACLVSDGLIYYDEVFDAATGYLSGDMLRVTFKGQAVTTAEPNTYDIFPSGGIMVTVGILADTPDVNVARISGSATAANVLELFALALDQGTGQIDSGTLANDTIQASKVQDGAFTAGKFADAFLTAAKIATDAITAAKVAADVTTEIQNGLATAAALATVDTNVDAVLVDTGTSLPALIGTPAADLAADIAAILSAVQALNDLSAAAVNAEVVDALSTDTYAEPGAIPAATASLAAKLSFLYTLARNKTTQSSTTKTLRNDADTASIGTSTVSDNGSVFSKGKWT